MCYKRKICLGPGSCGGGRSEQGETRDRLGRRLVRLLSWHGKSSELRWGWGLKRGGGEPDKDFGDSVCLVGWKLWSEEKGGGRCAAWVLGFGAHSDSRDQRGWSDWGRQFRIGHGKCEGLWMSRDAHETLKLSGVKLRRQSFCWTERCGHQQLGVSKVLFVGEMPKKPMYRKMKPKTHWFVRVSKESGIYKRYTKYSSLFFYKSLSTVEPQKGQDEMNCHNLGSFLPDPKFFWRPMPVPHPPWVRGVGESCF